MNRPVSRFALALLALLVLGLPAHAQLFRAYLSLSGSDSNACTLQAPCRLLPAALAAVADGGEVWILDSANYNTGQVTIAKSVSIIAVPGQIASFVTTTGANALAIGTANVSVALRNLVFTRLGATGLAGVLMTDGSQLSVENCLFANLPGNGIQLDNTTARVSVTNSVFRNMPMGSGVRAHNGPNVDIANSRFINLEIGAYAYTDAGSTTTILSITDSSFAGNFSGVISETDVATATTLVALTRSTLQGNTTGLQVDNPFNSGTATLTVANSTVTGILYQAFFQSGTGTTLRSLGNNYIETGGMDVGALTSVALR
jgi:hypothetical protein